MHVQEIKNELLQSPLWARVRESDGHKIFYTGQCLLIKHTLPFGLSWLYSPRPAIRDEEQLKPLIQSVAAIAKRENAVFWKIEGIDPLLLPLHKGEIQRGCPLQPPQTFLLDLSPSENKLLARMKEKTRYNIRLAKKKGVTERWSKDLNDVDVFYRLLRKTAKRQKIGIHSEEHYRNIVKILGKENAAAIIFAYYQNQPIAANLVTFFSDTATYLHGGADHQYRSLMAPYLLQWEAIREAQKRGCHYYDFGGCAITRGKINEWAGITRFKEGFGGELFDFWETYDVVFKRRWYWLYKLWNRLKTLIN